MTRDLTPLPRVGLAAMPDRAFQSTVAPLVAAGVVEALEWSFDVVAPPPHGIEDVQAASWAEALCEEHASAGTLLGHGVHYSLLSGELTSRHRRWLAEARRATRARRCVHVSEHFGFMTAGTYEQAPPLPVPWTAGTVKLGRDRVQRLADAVQAPVGLENLALAFGAADVRSQAALLGEILETSDAFLLLDLHNIYCQAHNFSIDPGELLSLYPLARVRELHVSGGSWSWPKTDPFGRPFRRDTHDGPVPAEVLALLRLALRRCAGVKVVIVERLGHTLDDVKEQERFRADYLAVRTLVTEASGE